MSIKWWQWALIIPGLLLALGAVDQAGDTHLLACFIGVLMIGAGTLPEKAQ